MGPITSEEMRTRENKAK